MCFNEHSEMQGKTANCNVNSDEPVFFPFSIKTNKCSSSCNSISDPYAKMYVPDVVKKMSKYLI